MVARPWMALPVRKQPVRPAEGDRNSPLRGVAPRIEAPPLRHLFLCFEPQTDLSQQVVLVHPVTHPLA